jgi:hypothetical protein
MPTLDALTTSVFRDLADEGKQVFTTLQVEDFIRGGIVELNRVAPLDTYEDIEFFSDISEYPTMINLPYRVEVRGPGGVAVSPIPQVEPGESVTYGWAHRASGDAGVIEVGVGIANAAAAINDSERPHMRVYGYARRPIPASTMYELSDPDDPESPMVPLASPETGLSSDEEYAVREYAKAEGFTLLTHDRALFAQWQGQTNNTDVSPVMMMNMAAIARQEWNRKRGLIRTVRRYW